MTAYYVVSEAPANAAEHANASSAHVSVGRRGRALWLESSDEGAGGADPSRCSGLVGLKDRVEAGGGGLTFESCPGHGTRLTVELPLHASTPAGAAP